MRVLRRHGLALALKRGQPHRNSEGALNSHEAFACTSCHAGLRFCPERRCPNTGHPRRRGTRRAQLHPMSDDVESLTKALQAQGDKLSEGERASRAKTIDDKKKQLERQGEDAQNDFQGEMQELYNGLASKVYDVLATYAQQQGFTLVLDVAQQQNPVLYATESTNITKQIIDAYNVKSGVPAPPAPAAGSAAPAPAPRPSAPRPTVPKAPATH